MACFATNLPTYGSPPPPVPSTAAPTAILSTLSSVKNLMLLSPHISNLFYTL